MHEAEVIQRERAYLSPHIQSHVYKKFVSFLNISSSISGAPGKALDKEQFDQREQRHTPGL